MALGGASHARGPWRLAALMVALSTLVTLAAIELVLRVRAGQLLGRPAAASSQLRMVGRVYPGSYHPRLGHVPTPDFAGRIDIWRRDVAITAEGVRSNGAAPPPGTPVIAVGDSFTFGDQVGDAETWPAQLEAQLGRPVVNGGVFGYGFDQIVLRAEALLDRVPADLLIANVLPDDVLRCEYAYRYAWKPYFEVREGALVLRNVPVPEPHRGDPGESIFRRWLRSSFLADLVFRRLTPDTWLLPDSIRIHRQGVAVAKLLMERLARQTRRRGVSLLLAIQWHPGGPIDPARGLAARARELGVDVVMLADSLRRASREDDGGIGRIFHASEGPGGSLRVGHMTAAGHEIVARELAGWIDARGPDDPALRSADGGV